MKKNLVIVFSFLLFACSEKQGGQKPPLTAGQTADEILSALKDKDYERVMPFVVDLGKLMDRQIIIAKELLGTKAGQKMLKGMGKSREVALADLERIVQARKDRHEDHQLGYEKQLREKFKTIAVELQAVDIQSLQAETKSISDSQLIAELPLVEARREYHYKTGQGRLVVNLVCLDKSWYVKNLVLE